MWRCCPALHVAALEVFGSSETWATIFTQYSEQHPARLTPLLADVGLYIFLMMSASGIRGISAMCISFAARLVQVVRWSARVLHVVRAARGEGSLRRCLAIKFCGPGFIQGVFFCFRCGVPTW